MEQEVQEKNLTSQGLEKLYDYLQLQYCKTKFKITNQAFLNLLDKIYNEISYVNDTPYLLSQVNQIIGPNKDNRDDIPNKQIPFPNVVIDQGLVRVFWSMKKADDGSYMSTKRHLELEFRGLDECDDSDTEISIYRCYIETKTYFYYSKQIRKLMTYDSRIISDLLFTSDKSDDKTIDPKTLVSFLIGMAYEYEFTTDEEDFK